METSQHPTLACPAYVEVPDGSFVPIEKATTEEIQQFMAFDDTSAGTVAALRQYLKEVRGVGAPEPVERTISLSRLPVLEHAYIDVADGEAVLHLLDVDEDEPIMIIVPEETVRTLGEVVAQIAEIYMGDAS